jgi:hypothetical protein
MTGDSAIPGPLDTVKRALQAYLDKDRAAIEAVIADVVFQATAHLGRAVQAVSIAPKRVAALYFLSRYASCGLND